MSRLPRPAVRDAAAIIAAEAFRLPRIEALRYLASIDAVASEHRDGGDFLAATALVRRDLFNASLG